MEVWMKWCKWLVKWCCSPTTAFCSGMVDVLLMAFFTPSFKPSVISFRNVSFIVVNEVNERKGGRIRVEGKSTSENPCSLISHECSALSECGAVPILRFNRYIQTYIWQSKCFYTDDFMIFRKFNNVILSVRCWWMISLLLLSRNIPWKKVDQAVGTNFRRVKKTIWRSVKARCQEGVMTLYKGAGMLERSASRMVEQHLLSETLGRI